MKKSKYIFIVIALFLVSLFSYCVEDDDNNGSNDTIPSKINIKQAKKFDREAAEILVGFVSSIEMAALIKELDVPYSQNFLFPSKAVYNFDTNFKKAFGLGVLSVDLGYLNMYKKTGSNIKYLKAIRKVADDLDIDHLFNFQMIKKLALNSDNIDSLIFLSVRSYHSMNEHLIKTKRQHLCALLVTGVWVESMHLGCRVNKIADDKGLRQRIGQQKDMLLSLYKILQIFEDKPEFKGLLVDIKRLVDIYDGVKVTVKTGEPDSTKIVDDISETVQSEYTVVEMSDEQFNKIAKLLSEIRNRFVN